MYYDDLCKSCLAHDTEKYPDMLIVDIQKISDTSIDENIKKREQDIQKIEKWFNLAYADFGKTESKIIRTTELYELNFTQILVYETLTKLFKLKIEVYERSFDKLKDLNADKIQKPKQEIIIKRRARVKKLTKQGMNVNDIAEKLGFGLSTIKKDLKIISDQ